MKIQYLKVPFILIFLEHINTTFTPNDISNHNELHMVIHFFSTGFQVTEEQLEEVAAMSGVLEVPDDFLVLEFRKKCEKILPDLYCCQ